MLNDYKAVTAPSSADRHPKPVRRSFIDDITIQHEPRAVLGRYFLRAEHEMQQRGLTVSFISAAELCKVNAHNQSSWGKLIPVLDARVNRIDPADIVCLGAFDASGALVACVAARRVMVETSVTVAMESLQFFYGLGAAAKSETDTFTLTAPSAAFLCGTMVYLGGLWVHPKQRYEALSVEMTRLVRYAALAAWQPDYEITIVTRAFLRPDIAAGYAFKAIEPGFVYTMNGSIVWQGVFAWSDREAMLSNLDRNLANLELAASLHHGSSQQIGLRLARKG